jgi:hypothetical protein
MIVMSLSPLLSLNVPRRRRGVIVNASNSFINCSDVKALLLSKIIFSSLMRNNEESYLFMDRIKRQARKCF